MPRPVSDPPRAARDCPQCADVKPQAQLRIIAKAQLAIMLKQGRHGDNAVVPPPRANRPPRAPHCQYTLRALVHASNGRLRTFRLQDQVERGAKREASEGSEPVSELRSPASGDGGGDGERAKRVSSTSSRSTVGSASDSGDYQDAEYYSDTEPVRPPPACVPR